MGLGATRSTRLPLGRHVILPTDLLLVGVRGVAVEPLFRAVQSDTALLGLRQLILDALAAAQGVLVVAALLPSMQPGMVALGAVLSPAEPPSRGVEVRLTEFQTSRSSSLSDHLGLGLTLREGHYAGAAAQVRVLLGDVHVL